jgi:hypothetical protein
MPDRGAVAHLVFRVMLWVQVAFVDMGACDLDFVRDDPDADLVDRRTDKQSPRRRSSHQDRRR